MWRLFDGYFGQQPLLPFMEVNLEGARTPGWDNMTI